MSVMNSQGHRCHKIKAHQDSLCSNLAWALKTTDAFYAMSNICCRVCYFLVVFIVQIWLAEEPICSISTEWMKSDTANVYNMFYSNRTTAILSKGSSVVKNNCSQRQSQNHCWFIGKQKKTRNSFKNDSRNVSFKWSSYEKVVCH